MVKGGVVTLMDPGKTMMVNVGLTPVNGGSSMVFEQLPRAYLYGLLGPFQYLAEPTTLPCIKMRLILLRK